MSTVFAVPEPITAEIIIAIRVKAALPVMLTAGNALKPMARPAQATRNAPAATACIIIAVLYLNIAAMIIATAANLVQIAPKTAALADQVAATALVNRAKAVPIVPAIAGFVKNQAVLFVLLLTSV